MKALLLVDIQNDFLPGGALAVKNGGEILPIINNLVNYPFNLIVATKDWHPIDHSSFAATHNKLPGECIIINEMEQILWPLHCIQGTQGAEFHSILNTEKIDKIFYKGTDKVIDSYSAFYDNGHFKSTGLDKYLHDKGIKEIYIAGLTTDYCVKYSVLDALKLGFKVFVIMDACRGVDLKKNDSYKALEEMRNAGAGMITSDEFCKSRGSGI